jgi:formylglycine-generating enzyme required for sulfatase activity
VGKKVANELGIYDMTGNVFEWCWDVYDPYPSYRRFRGGGWFYNAGLGAVSYRVNRNLPAYRDFSNGFRPACSSGN